MAITRARKEEIVSDLKSIFEEAKSVVFVHFHGLTVGDETAMRRKLKELGIHYIVAKKTLTKIALEQSSAKGEIPELVGEIAVAYGEDETGPAREIYSFGKQFKGAVEIAGGIFENKLQDKEQMNEIAQIPSLHVLHGMFVNVINSPIQGLAIVLDQIARKKQ